MPTRHGEAVLQVRAMWEHAFADVVPSQTVAFAGSPTAFTVNGSDAGRDRLRLGAGIAWDVSETMSLNVSYDGLFSDSQQSHTANIGINIRF